MCVRVNEWEAWMTSGLLLECLLVHPQGCLSLRLFVVFDLDCRSAHTMSREEEAQVEDVEEEEEEVVDPKPAIENSCKPRCVKQLLTYEACVKRVDGDEHGQKHCTGQYFDYWGCIDQCAAPKIFQKLN